MTYTAVVPVTNWATYRADLNGALSDMIAAFQAQVPGVIRKQWSEIPASFTGETPLVYLGDIVETILHSGGQRSGAVSDGLRHCAFHGTIGYVDTSPDNQEANTRANTFADYMRDLFSANCRILGGGILDQTGLREAPATDGPLHGFMHLVLDWEYNIGDGRT